MLNVLVVLVGLAIVLVSVLFGIFIPLTRRAQESFQTRTPVPAPKAHILGGVVGAVVGGFIAVIGLSGPFVEVPPGNVGVVTNFGQVQTVTLEPGLHVVVPIYQRVTNVDTRVLDLLDDVAQVVGPTLGFGAAGGEIGQLAAQRA